MPSTKRKTAKSAKPAKANAVPDLWPLIERLGAMIDALQKLVAEMYPPAPSAARARKRATGRRRGARR